jgi:transposase
VPLFGVERTPPEGVPVPPCFPAQARLRPEARDLPVVNKIKPCRRVATRYDKIAANDLAFIQLAAIRLWLRVN